MNVPAFNFISMLSAFKRLSKYAILDRRTVGFLQESHYFLITADTLVRLKGENVLKNNFDLLDTLRRSFHIPSPDLLLKNIAEIRL